MGKNGLHLNVMMDDEIRGNILELIREQIQPALTAFVADMCAPENLEKAMEKYLKSQGADKAAILIAQRTAFEMTNDKIFFEALTNRVNSQIDAHLHRMLDAKLGKLIEDKIREYMRNGHLRTTLEFKDR
jgi:uncharacterized protein (DUF885 family)